MFQDAQWSRHRGWRTRLQSLAVRGAVLIPPVSDFSKNLGKQVPLQMISSGIRQQKVVGSRFPIPVNIAKELVLPNEDFPVPGNINGIFSKRFGLAGIFVGEPYIELLADNNGSGHTTFFRGLTAGDP